MSTSFAGKLPAPLERLRAGNWHQVTLGKSEAAVWQIEADGQTSFLKVAATHALSELPGEAARLRWLSGTAVSVPAVSAFIEDGGRSWLLMSALPGQDLTRLVNRPLLLCNALATGLRALHSLDIASCPFDQKLDAKLASGAANVAANRVDETDFDDARNGWTAVAVLDWLLQHRPTEADLVVTHGDASLPNLMADNGAFSGVIDCGRLGVADRWQDLAIACRSVIFNCGQDHVATFLGLYGAEWDAQRYSYYTTLDELF